MAQTTSQKCEKANSTTSDSNGGSTKVDVSKKSQNKSESSSFGGMKKGFLFRGTPKTKSVQENKTSDSDRSKSDSTVNKGNETKKNKTLEDIPFVRKNESAKTGELRFSEVQEAMEKTNSKLMENKGSIIKVLIVSI